MASLYEQVRDDVNHISRLVRQQQASLKDSSFDMSAAVQAQAIAVKNRILVLGSLQPAQSSELQELVLAGPWTDIQKGDISSAITAGCVSSGALAGGPLSPKHQTLENFMGYLSVADTGKLKDPAMNKYTKLEILSTRALAVGLFKPDEKTFKNILGAGVSAGLELAAQEKLPMMTELKRILRNGAKRSSHPTPWMDRYPCAPGELPDTLRKCYETDPPAGLVAMAAVDLPCRKSSASSYQIMFSVVDFETFRSAIKTPNQHFKDNLADYISEFNELDSKFFPKPAQVSWSEMLPQAVLAALQCHPMGHLAIWQLKALHTS